MVRVSGIRQNIGVGGSRFGVNVLELTAIHQSITQRNVLIDMHIAHHSSNIMILMRKRKQIKWPRSRTANAAGLNPV